MVRRLSMLAIVLCAAGCRQVFGIDKPSHLPPDGDGIDIGTTDAAIDAARGCLGSSPQDFVCFTRCRRAQ